MLRATLVLAALLALGMPAAAADLSASHATAIESSVQSEQPTAKLDIDINSNTGRWWASPVWIAIGAIAFIVLVLLIVMAVRGGGGTTIVKE